MTSPASPRSQLHWSVVLRALREARSLTQDGWAAHLGVGRRTVQRWEQGLAAPDTSARRAILAYAEERGLYRRFDAGPLAGFTLTPEWLGDLLAAAQPGSSDHGGRGGFQTRPRGHEDSTPSSDLPVPLTTLIGREHEIEATTRLLESARLVTLTGPGGTGKTRLALAVAERLRSDGRDGVWFIDLSAIGDPGLVPATVAHSLGVRESEEAPIAETLTAYLRDRPMLLVLDNVEQVAGAAPFLRDLLAACPYLRLLLTSRTVLHIPGEREYAVPPLPLPEHGAARSAAALAANPAVVLFVERAKAVRPDFLLTDENAAAVVEICAQLDGLPLAIELAAARVKILSPHALLGRLDQRLRLLSASGAALPDRQRTLRGTMQWSYDLLDEPERRLFRRLAVFAGGCSLAAAEAVGDADGDLGVDVLDGLGSLVDKNLLRQADEVDGEPCFTMLATIREFALEQLDASADAPDVRRSHAQYFLALAEEAAPRLREADGIAWLDRLEREQENMRAALDWLIETGDSEHALRLAGALWWYWSIRAHFGEGVTALDRALALGGGSASARAAALQGAAYLRWAFDQSDLATQQMEEAVALRRADGDLRGLIATLNWYGNVALRNNDLDKAEALHSEALSLRREIGDEHGVASSLGNLGIVACSRGAYAEALALFAECLPIHRRFGDVWAIALSHNMMAYAYLGLGEPDRAAAVFHDGFPSILELRLGMMGGALGLAAAIAQDCGDVERAARLGGAATGAEERMGGVQVLARFLLLDLQRRTEQLRAALGEDAFAAAWDEGRALSLDAAVALALEQAGST